LGKLQDYWDERAGLGETSGTQDRLAKQLEIQAISQRVKDGMRVLDVGCGDGETAADLARIYDIDITGVDFSEAMLTRARSRAPGIDFLCRNVTDLGPFPQKFDLIYTERTIINLPDWETQKKAIQDIRALLTPDGRYIMCENSWDGLQGINGWREAVGLPHIQEPWHNRYIKDFEVDALGWIVRIDYSSTYYFVSRVLNAKLAQDQGQEPDYDSPLNQLAATLPPIGIRLGQGRIWVFGP
jgi:SAM-dependent methyltransferase